MPELALMVKCLNCGEEFTLHFHTACPKCFSLRWKTLMTTVKETNVVHVHEHPYDVYCGRGNDPLTGAPGEWGNPWSHIPGSMAKYRTRTKWEAVRRHEEWVRGQPFLVVRIKAELKGKVLGCWCNDRICHAVTLARIADEE